MDSFIKIFKTEGTFTNEDSLLKALCLRTIELYRKWNGSTIRDWAIVSNQLSIDDNLKARMAKYENY